MKKSLLLVLLYLFCAGNTDCGYFSRTTVPSSDSAPPTVWASMIRKGEQTAPIAAPRELRTIWFTEENAMVVHAATDGGGVRDLRTSHRYETTCCTSWGECRTSVDYLPDAAASQSGGVGSTVSNGLYTLEVLRGPSCPAGQTFRSFRYLWQTQAVDFHGQVATGPLNEIGQLPL